MVNQNIVNEYDDGTPLRFVHEQLTASADFQALYKDKLFEQVRIPSKPGDTYCYVEISDNAPLLMYGIGEYVAKIEATIKVICVRKYPTGKGSEMDFGPIIRILRRTLCGHKGTRVRNFAGEVIGEVDQTCFVKPTDLISKTEGTFDALHKGIRVYMTYRPPEA